MKHFVGDEVVRIKIDKEHWVDIKSRMSYGDQQRLVAHYVKESSLNLSSGIDIDVATGNIELLIINIKNWNLVDDNGEPVKVSPEAISDLDPIVANKIAGEIGERNTPPKA